MNVRTPLLAIAVLAALLVSSYLLARPRAEAQQAVDAERNERIVGQLRKLSEERQRLENERRYLEHESLSSMRDLDARQNQLKRELEELEAKRVALQRSLEQRRQALQAKMDALTAEIQAVKASAAPGAVGISPYQPIPKQSGRVEGSSVEEKLDQILKRLEMMETRLDRLEKSAKPK